MGIALSFISLADINKRTKIGDKIFGNSKYAKRWIIYVVMVLVTIYSMGVYTHFFTEKETLKDLSIGIFVLGIGMIGMLRMTLEIIKSYQADWN